MKEILGNWNKFINEQESPPVQVRLELLARANLGLNNAKYDKIWSKIVERTKNFNLEKLANSVRKEVFYTFDSELAEKSFVRMARQKDLGGINSKTTDEEILKQYREVYLPKIKNILESVPVINLASEQATGNKTFKRAIEFATNSAKDGKGVRGFFSYFVDSEKGYIAVVPYFHMRKNGTLGLGAIKRTLLEEFIHAVDIIMGGAPPESSGIQPSATGKGFVSGGATGGGSAPTAPSFNLIEGTADNQINESINLGNQEPIQAFVVSGDVTTAQNLDKNIITESGL